MGIYRDLARQLYNTYYDYYCTVAFDFIVEAVYNSVIDLQGVIDLPDLHQNIIEIGGTKNGNN